MHLNESELPEGYLNYVWKKMIFLIGSLLFLIFSIAFSVSVGAVNIPLPEVFKVLIGNAQSSTLAYNYMEYSFTSGFNGSSCWDWIPVLRVLQCNRF